MTVHDLPVPLDADGTGVARVDGRARLAGNLASNGRAWRSPAVALTLVFGVYPTPDPHSTATACAFEAEPVGLVTLEGPVHSALDGARIEFEATTALGGVFRLAQVVAARMMPGLSVRWGTGPERGTTADGLMPPCPACGHRMGRHRRRGAWRCCIEGACGCGVRA